MQGQSRRRKPEDQSPLASTVSRNQEGLSPTTLCGDAGCALHCPRGREGKLTAIIAVLLHKCFLVVTLLVLLAGCICVGMAWAEDTKELVVVRTESPPMIDGALDDACWKTAARGEGLILSSVGGLEGVPFIVEG